MSDAAVVAASLLWLGLLFAVARWGERRPQLLARQWPVVYSLSLAVYCTSWTFYGTVTQALRSGWPLPPTFLGTILLYLFGFGLLLRLLRLAREHNTTSIADLIATRLGRSSLLAAAVTFVAILGIVPYIALQLKAVAMSYGQITRAADLSPPVWQDIALYVALSMAVFAMLFGTRAAAVTAHNRGLVLAMAAESLFKLVAMLALGAFVWFGLDLPERIAVPVQPGGSEGFPALVLLGALAMVVLPHQFHVGVVECRDERQLRTARWLFPLYMVLIALPILPIASAGAALLGPLGVASDMYVLALPLAEGQRGLALLAFLGGLSAATGMVILSTLALSLMVGNHWLAPLLVKAGWGRPSDAGSDLRAAVLVQRRVGILVIVLLAWLFSRATSGNDALADIGAVSFSGLATLAPALAFAIWRPGTPPHAVLIGLVVSVLVWAWVLLVPTLVADLAPAFVSEGPFGIAWLAPDAMFGLSTWSRVGRATVLSLLIGGLMTAMLAARLPSLPTRERGRALSQDNLRLLAARFLPPAQIEAAFDVPASDPAEVERRIERELASVLGAASARLLVDAARREQSHDLDAVATIVGEASQALRFNQRVLEAALENMSQGISVVDAELRLVAWNRRYAELFAYPPQLLRVGVPIADLVAWNISRGLAGSRGVESEVAKRIEHMRAGTPYVAERSFGEQVIEIRGNPMPGGGFVATFTDVTAFRRAERALKSAADQLEQRVAERTAELASAKAEAERANRGKTRFLAAVSHDLAQPLNASHLFVHALMQTPLDPAVRQQLTHVDGALGSAEALLAGLLDISRLDAGGMQAALQDFRLDDVLAGLAAEFGVLAAQKGLVLRRVPTRAWVRSDPQLLRRVLQNFLANAVRYTPRGRVLLGCRRVGQALQLEVWDTGPGIADADRALVFEEFRRLGVGGQGLGLGLAIADRIARLLGHPLDLRSWPGHGTVFSIRVPLVSARPAVTMAEEPAALAPRSRVLIVDNDREVLGGMVALVGGWQCEVIAASGIEQAAQALHSSSPDLLLLDFHLDGGLTGLDLRQRLGLTGLPCVVITADHSEAVKQAIRDAGCLLLHKPLKPLALKSAMARLLAVRRG